MTDIDERIDEIKVGFDIGRTDEDESCATFMRGDTVIGILYGDAAKYVCKLQAQVVERDKRISTYKSLVASQEKITSWYRQQDYSHSEPRLKQLEESLESEREMNAKLTDELEAAINKAGGVMNKSDIMKAAEEAVNCTPADIFKLRDSLIAAAELLKQVEEKYQNPMYSIEPNGDTRLVDAQYFYDLTAQRDAALGRLGWFESQVEVLPEGSEPMVGDLLVSTKGIMGGVSCGYLYAKSWTPPTGDITNHDYWTIQPRFGDGKHPDKFWANPKEWQTIIQRAGKPVIIEKEGV